METKFRAAKKVAPDGGWGWMTTFGVSLVNLATRSIEPSFGLLFGDLLNDLQVGTTGAAIIISTLDVCMNFSGLFVGPLLKEFSYRKVAIAGSFLCCLGLALTSPATSMPHILVTYSVINGIGVGLATSAAFVALNHYFSRKRGQAVGLSMAGTALGMLIMPQLVRVLLETYNFRGTILVLAGLSLHAVLGSTLLQPVKWHMVEEEVDVEMIEPPQMGIIIEQDDDDADSLPEIKTLLFPKRFRPLSESSNSSNPKFPRITSSVSMANHPVNGITRRPTFPRITSTASMTLALKQRRQSTLSTLSRVDFGSGSCMQIHLDTGDPDVEEVDYKVIRRVNTHVGAVTSLGSFSKKHKPIETVKSELGLEMIARPKESFIKRFSSLMDVGILRDVVYLNILFGLSIFYVAEMNFKMVTPFFLSDLGYPKSEVATLLSISALTDIAARVFVPPICDKLDISKRLIFMISIFFVAITRSIVAEQTTYTELVVWLSITGFFRGVALSNFTLTVSEHSSLEKLPAAFGWHMIGKGVFVSLFGPLIGAIRDWTKSYPMCIHAQSVCIFLCIIAWTIEYFINWIKSKKVATETN